MNNLLVHVLLAQGHKQFCNGHAGFGLCLLVGVIGYAVERDGGRGVSGISTRRAIHRQANGMQCGGGIERCGREGVSKRGRGVILTGDIPL